MGAAEAVPQMAAVDSSRAAIGVRILGKVHLQRCVASALLSRAGECCNAAPQSQSRGSSNRLRLVPQVAPQGGVG